MQIDDASCPRVVRSHEASLAALITASAVAVGLAIQIQDGEYTPVAMLLVTLALLLTGIAVCWRTLAFLPERWLVAVVVGGLLVEFTELFTAWPGVDLPHTGTRLAPFFSGLIVALVLIAVGLVERNGNERSVKPQGVIALPWFGLLIAANLFLSFWMIRSSPRPQIDVWVFQQDAAQALLWGHNPYVMTFPDIYHSTMPGHQQVYGQGLVENDRLRFGFPYPPVSLLLATIGYAVAHDHRYAQAVALAISGLFIGYSRPGLIAKLAAALLLFTPRVFFVIGRAWTEPFTIMLLAATVWLACRRSRLLPVAFGLLLATKQYMVLAVPISFFLLRPGWRWRDWFDLLWKAALVACVVTLPLALLDFRAFWKSTVTVQELAPFRWDALSYLVWYGFRGHLVTEPFTAVFWSTLAALVTLALSLWRAPRTPAGFAASLALILLAFFAFNKQAFCNYYFFAIGAMCCAVGALAIGATSASDPEPSPR
jgi:hypothetical protein